MTTSSGMKVTIWGQRYPRLCFSNEISKVFTIQVNSSAARHTCGLYSLSNRVGSLGLVNCLPAVPQDALICSKVFSFTRTIHLYYSTEQHISAM